MTAEEYAEHLEENLRDLHERIQSGRYKAPPVKRAWLDRRLIATGAAAIGAAVAVVIAAIAIAVLQGIAVVAAAAIPGELQAQVQAAQVAPDLRASIGTAAGQQELYTGTTQMWSSASAGPTLAGRASRRARLQSR